MVGMETGSSQQGEVLLGSPKIQGQKTPTGFSGMDISETLVGVVKAEVEVGVRKWREAGCEGRKEDPRGEVRRVTRSSFCFVLFATKQDHFPNVLGVNMEERERWNVQEKEEGRDPEPGGGLSLGQGHRRGRG